MRGFDSSSVLLTVRRTKWASSYEWNILTGKVSTEYILVKKFNEPRFVLVGTLVSTLRGFRCTNVLVLYGEAVNKQIIINNYINK